MCNSSNDLACDSFPDPVEDGPLGPFDAVSEWCDLLGLLLYFPPHQVISKTFIWKKDGRLNGGIASINALSLDEQKFYMW